MKQNVLKSGLKWIAGFLFGGAVTYMVYLLLEMPDQMDQGISEVTKEWAKGPAQEAFNVSFIYSDSAVIQAVLKAPHAVEVSDSTGVKQTRLFDRSFEVTFFSPDGSKASVMTADTGEVFHQAEEGQAWGNVKIVSFTDSSTVKAKRLFWNNKIGRIWTNDSVNITTGNEIIYGDSMEADSGFAKFRIYKVYGSVQLQEGV